MDDVNNAKASVVHSPYPSALQFIDLSDIAEPERNSILASLRRSNPSVRGPWRVRAGVAVAASEPPSPPAQQNAARTPDVAPSTVAKSWASLLKPRGPVSSVAAPRTNGIARARNPEFDDPHYYRIAEYLSSYVVEHRVVHLQPRGLVNRSNYCYINSILQALVACAPFYNLMDGLGKCADLSETKKHVNIIANMAKFVREFKALPPNAAPNRAQRQQQQQSHANGQQAAAAAAAAPNVPVACDTAFEPKWMYRALNGVRNDTFQVEGRQEDAEEFLGCLLNGLNDEMLELIKLVKSINEPANNNNNSNNAEADSWNVVDSKNKGTITRRTELSQTPISDIFGGQLCSRVHRAGDRPTDNIQPFFTLQLHIEKVSSVREALEQLVARNTLEGVMSSRTNQQVQAWQQVTIEQLPVVLILHLKYFDYRVDGCAKILKQIEFPIELRIESKLLSSKSNHGPATERQYQLFAVVYHDGHESSKGHYVTDTYHQGLGTWLRCDDATLRPIHCQTVLQPYGSRVPYLLFYRRMDSVAGK